MRVKNFREKSVITEFHIRDFVTDHKVWKFIEDKFRFHISSDGTFMINNKKIYAEVLQDVNNEPSNKRLQGNYLKNFYIKGYNIWGLYPVLDHDNKLVDIMVVEWENEKIHDIIYTKTNPALKVKVEEVLKGYLEQGLVFGNSLKYGSYIFSISYILDINDINEIVDLYKEKEVSEHELASYVTLRMRNNKLQRIFRGKLLKEYNHKCCLCDIDQDYLLRASHIIPVAKIIKDVSLTPREKADLISTPENGLLLCANHDVLFDGGYISFDEMGMIAISDELLPSIDLVNIDVIQEIETKKYSQPYMLYHYSKIFKK